MKLLRQSMPSYRKHTVCFPPVVWYSPPVSGSFIQSGLLSVDRTLSPMQLCNLLMTNCPRYLTADQLDANITQQPFACHDTPLHGQGVLQSSNVATYIAHGDVALSVLMTTASTLGAIVMTPLLTKTLAGAYIAVDAKVCECFHVHCHFARGSAFRQCAQRR